jgi:hypothetical protein
MSQVHIKIRYLSFGKEVLRSEARLYDLDRKAKGSPRSHQLFGLHRSVKQNA